MRNTINQALKTIKEDFGDDNVFLNAKQFRAVLSDVKIETDEKQVRHLLNIAVREMQVYSRLKTELNNNVFIVDNLTAEMSSDYVIDKDTAKIVIECFAELLGYVPAITQAEKSQSKKEKPQNKSQTQKQTMSSQQTSVPPGVNALMTRAWQFAEDGDWQDAADYFNKVLDNDPSYAPAFLGLLCVDLKAPKADKLANAKKPTDITNHKHYKRAITDPAVKRELNGYVRAITARINKEQKATEKAEAERKREAAEKAEAEWRLKAAREAFLKKRAQDAFDNAIEIMNNANSPDDYRKVITAFGNINSNYEDINSKVKSKIAECERMMQQMIPKLSTKLHSVLQSNTWKSQGLCTHDGGKIKGLRSKKCSVCGKSPSETIRTAHLFEEDLTSIINLNINLAGIKWRILNVQDGKLLLISEEVLETRQYNVEQKDITWETCTLRQYLNGEFYNKFGAFKSAITDTQNNNHNNPWYGTAGGNMTTDKLFLLSLEEIVKYFGDSEDLSRHVRKIFNGHHKNDGYLVNDQYNNARMAKYKDRPNSWWLRSPGSDGTRAAIIDVNGCCHVFGGDVRGISHLGTHDCGVRPALWLNIDKLDKTSIENNVNSTNLLEDTPLTNTKQTPIDKSDPNEISVKLWSVKEWKEIINRHMKGINELPKKQKRQAIINALKNIQMETPVEMLDVEAMCNALADDDVKPCKNGVSM